MTLIMVNNTPAMMLDGWGVFKLEFQLRIRVKQCEIEGNYLLFFDFALEVDLLSFDCSKGC